MNKVALAACIVVAMVAPSHAQWISDSGGGDFDDDPVHVALTAKGRSAFGLRCNSEVREFVFITPEAAADADTLKMMNAVAPKLKVRLDKGSIIDLDADLEDRDDKLTVVAEVDPEFFKRVRDAKSAIAVTLSVLGKNYHETSFNARGSNAAITKIMKGCKID